MLAKVHSPAVRKYTFIVSLLHRHQPTGLVLVTVRTPLVASATVIAQGPLGARHVPVHLSVWPVRSSGVCPTGRVDTTVEHPQRETNNRTDIIHFIAASYRWCGGR